MSNIIPNTILNIAYTRNICMYVSTTRVGIYTKLANANKNLTKCKKPIAETNQR